VDGELEDNEHCLVRLFLWKNRMNNSPQGYFMPLISISQIVSDSLASQCISIRLG